MKFKPLTAQQLDALKETASIGVSHAANALSKMLNEKVMIVVPTVNILPVKDFSMLLGHSAEIIVGVYFRVLGKASGRILVSFKKDSACALVDVLQKRTPGTTKVLTPLDQDTLNEASMVLTASCLNALAQFLGMTLMPSVPTFAFDRPPAMVDRIFRDLPKGIEYLLVVDSEFQAHTSKIQGRFFVFPDDHTLSVVWRSVGVKD